uniref:Uncharacterized protein n=1 Tax=Knipowitschia caucasica TaxID=637954 RepID=A0AAV2LE56_KNICA
MTTGRQMTLPLHRLYQPAEANIATTYTTHQYRTDPQDHLEQTFAFKQKKLGDSAEGRKAYYDQKESHNELQVGDQPDQYRSRSQRTRESQLWPATVRPIDYNVPQQTQDLWNPLLKDPL